MNYKLYTLKDFGDERGSLIPIENGNNVDFEVRRAFYIYGTTDGTIRGVHANKFSEFLMIVISGSCKVLVDDGFKKEVVELNHPNQALYLDKMVWKEMYDFSKDAVLLVLSNEKYNENEYIRDYNLFKRIVNRKFPRNCHPMVERVYTQDNYRVIKTNAKNSNAIILFTGNGIFANEEEAFKEIIIDNDRFEWENIVQDYNLREKYSLIILVRDIYKQWYLDGINENLNTQDKVIEKLKEITKGYKVTTCGNSAGGYMAVLAGCKMEADRIFTFSGQFYLLSDNLYWGPLVHEYINTERSKYYSLASLIKNTKSKIYYFYPGKCEQDITQAKHVEDCKNIYVFNFDESKHGVSFEYRCYKTILAQDDKVIEKLYSKYKNKVINPKQFTKDLHKNCSLKYNLIRFLQFIFFVENYHSLKVIKILGFKIKLKKKQVNNG